MVDITAGEVRTLRANRRLDFVGWTGEELAPWPMRR